MKKLFTIAALFILMISMTSFTPNEVGGRSSQTPNVEVGGRSSQTPNVEVGGRSSQTPNLEVGGRSSQTPN